jgi:NDP-sugar pyrophosphorylase family protein
VLPLAFSGIHVISPRVFSRMEENGAFSIITTYLHLAAQGARIIAFRADNSYWRDLGRPKHIPQAAQDLRFGVL